MGGQKTCQLWIVERNFENNNEDKQMNVMVARRGMIWIKNETRRRQQGQVHNFKPRNNNIRHKETRYRN